MFVDHGDALRNMVLHRAESHSLFWLSLFAPLLAALPAAVHRERGHFGRWWLAMWLALVTHPLLDAMTVYGTQLLLPFTDHPYGVGSMFIVDPLYTLPLLAGVGVALARRAWRGLGWNMAGLLLSSAYLAWSVLAQWHVRGVAEQALAARGTPATRLLVTPAPLNTLLWRVVAMHADGSYDEGFHSLLDGRRPLRLDRFAAEPGLREALRDNASVRTLARFSHGFYKLHARDGAAWIADLRMGQEPNYVFDFRVAERRGDAWVPVAPQQQGARGDVGRTLRWLWPRMLGADLPPPR